MSFSPSASAVAIVNCLQAMLGHKHLHESHGEHGDDDQYDDQDRQHNATRHLTPKCQRGVRP